MAADPSYSALRAYNHRLAGMLDDPECVGELLLVGIGIARSLDLGDPEPAEDGTLRMRVIAEQIYGNRRLPGNILGAVHLSDRGDRRPGRRIRDVFFADRRRYSPDVDGDRHWVDVICGRPMVRRDGLCGRSAGSRVQRLTDPATGQRRWLGCCSASACKRWFADLLARNRAELAAHPVPVPPANTGGVLERHLPEIDWWAVWRHVDSNWSPPPEGQAFERPTLRLITVDPGDNNEDVEPVVTTRPTLVVHKGGWR
jgi:hypothetical protein